MQWTPLNTRRGLLLLAAVAGTLMPLAGANAASCKTEAQMTAAQRDAVSGTARSLISQVQTGNVQAMRANTIPAVAADFSGIAASASSLMPLVQHAAITIDDMYALDAASEPAGAAETDFYCGSPIVVLNFTGLPPGSYALVIAHATGVPQPQQISLVLSETSANRWMLAGFFSGPMTEASHSGLWYWTKARDYAQKKMNLNAWLYYQTAASLLNPVQFMSSPNLQKLQREADKVKPDSFPGVKPMMVDAQGSPFAITAMNTTAALGALDLEVHYIPTAPQLAQLHDPVAARKQTIGVMAALLAQHPELRAAFHGIWLRADQGTSSVYALDLPMDQIAGGAAAAGTTANPIAH